MNTGVRRRDGVRILVAEDNPVSSTLLLDMLQTVGLRADSVADGRAALEAMEKRRYELVFLDCEMPEMDGYEVAAALRRQETGSIRTVVIAVTANASVDDEAFCRQAGMDDYLGKPVKMEQLVDALRRWMPVSDGSLDGAADTRSSPDSDKDPPLDVGTSP